MTELVERLRSSAKAFRENTVYTSDGDPVRLGVQADECAEAANHIERIEAELSQALSQMEVMREALGKAHEALCEYACHGGQSNPCLRSPSQCRSGCGLAAGDALLVVDAALAPKEPQS